MNASDSIDQRSASPVTPLTQTQRGVVCDLCGHDVAADLEMIESVGGCTCRLKLPCRQRQLSNLARPGLAPVNSTDSDDLEEFGPRYSLKDVRMIRALKGYIRHGKIKDACTAAGIKYATWYRWLAEEPEFARAYEQAKFILTTELEDEGMARAKASSDSLLMFFLRALQPDKYREKQTITVVSPDVQSRLSQQADAILDVCRQSLEDKELAAAVASAIANRLREIWT